MTLHQIWVAAILALAVQSGASHADVKLSTSNDPNAVLSSSFGALLGAEKTTIAALSVEKRTALAIGAMKLPAKVKAEVAAEPQAQEVAYTHAWLMDQSAASGDAQWECLKTALYFESRGEDLEGQFAVAEVILNRVDSVRYPNTICGVVEQGSSKGCQFSYSCDGKTEAMKDNEAEEISGRIARVMIDGAPRQLTGGATYFHTRSVRPSWSRKFPKTASIGAHLFYRQ